MKITPGYYVDWLEWSLQRAKALDGEAKLSFLREVWLVFTAIFTRLAPVSPITLGNVWKLAIARFDPLEDARNQMERIRRTYGPES